MTPYNPAFSAVLTGAGRMPEAFRETPSWPQAAFLAAENRLTEPVSLTDYWKARYPHYQLSPHIALMIEELEALEPGEALIITMPPRHSKTETVKAWMEWQLGQFPDSEAIYASYAVRLARTSSRSIRNEIATGRAFPRNFPAVGPGPRCSVGNRLGHQPQRLLPRCWRGWLHHRHGRTFRRDR